MQITKQSRAFKGKIDVQDKINSNIKHKRMSFFKVMVLYLYYFKAPCSQKWVSQ